MRAFLKMLSFNAPRNWVQKNGAKRRVANRFTTPRRPDGDGGGGVSEQRLTSTGIAFAAARVSGLSILFPPK
ncbi:hypothetical protein DESC_610123 [Desulfosarcina cetonica]|nr:hypothetical protein DESC_610123 [Desulfosarcina cetonica]